MYEHLSKRVDQVVKLASVVARDYGQEYVGTEHVLLAISREGTGLGAKILEAGGATYDKLKDQIDTLIKASLEDTWVFGRLPGTPHFKNVVASGIEEACELRSKNVCTEHLLLGLLLEKGSVAHQALRSLGFSARKVREEIARIAAAQ